MDSKKSSINTRCVQGGYTPGNGEPRQIPIVQSTTFKCDTSEDMGKLFDLEAHLFIPQEFFDCSLDEFWEKLPSLDADFEQRRQALQERQCHWRFVAEMDRGKCSVSLKEIDKSHSFYALDGSNNIILLTTERYNRHPMLIQGYGAGADVTAAGVFADIMSIANI